VNQAHNPVAIVGYGYRMPGGIRTDSDFWRLLSEREIVQEPIADRYGLGYRPIGGFTGPSRFASPHEGLVREDGEKLFDRTLFGMSHNEMTWTDAQVRMLLMCAWETCERVGWDLYALRNSPTGVFKLILEAFEGEPVHIEVLEFLQPCPIPKTPVRLQTALYPVPNVPDEFTFTISSRSYDVESKSELHCRGKVRRVSADYAVDVPTRLADIDTSRFESFFLVDDSDFAQGVATGRGRAGH